VGDTYTSAYLSLRMISVGNLQEESLKRREKLKALREKQRAPDEVYKEEMACQWEEKLPRPVFRSYQPQDENLKASQLPRVKPLEVADKVRDQLNISEPESVLDDVDLVKLAPRKPDWDLKRDIGKKLEKLDRRTQRAIAELIRDRLQPGRDDIALAVTYV